MQQLRGEVSQRMRIGVADLSPGQVRTDTTIDFATEDDLPYAQDFQQVNTISSEAKRGPLEEMSTTGPFAAFAVGHLRSCTWAADGCVLLMTLARLFISDDLVVDNGGFHSARVVSSSVYLSSGRHLLVLRLAAVHVKEVTLPSPVCVSPWQRVPSSGCHHARRIRGGVVLQVLQFFQGGYSGRMVFSYQGADTGFLRTVVPAEKVEPVSVIEAAYDDYVSFVVNFSYLPEGLSQLDCVPLLAGSSPQISNFTMVGSELHLMGSNFGNTTGLVALGTASNPSENLQCEVSTWSSVAVTCSLPDIWPAGEWSVRVWNPLLGWACPFHTTLLAVANLTSVEMHGVSRDVVVGDRWVPILRSDGSSVWGYDSELWVDENLLNASASFDEAANAKYAAFLSVPFRRIRMCVGSPNQNCVEHSFAR
eukprot:4170923-Amphidinium_carterae.1